MRAVDGTDGAVQPKYDGVTGRTVGNIITARLERDEFVVKARQIRRMVFMTIHDR